MLEEGQAAGEVRESGSGDWDATAARCRRRGPLHSAGKTRDKDNDAAGHRRPLASGRRSELGEIARMAAMAEGSDALLTERDCEVREELLEKR